MPKAKAKKTETKKRGGRKPTHSDDMIIQVVAKENPKRMGKKEKPFRAYKEWDFYAKFDGKTVGEYVAFMDKKFKDHGSHRENINYDVKHGFIRLHAPKQEMKQAA